MLDHKTGRSRGFGFVTFETEDAVEKIFADGQMHELGGKQVSSVDLQHPNLFWSLFNLSAKLTVISHFRLKLRGLSQKELEMTT